VHYWYLSNDSPTCHHRELVELLQRPLLLLHCFVDFVYEIGTMSRTTAIRNWVLLLLRQESVLDPPGTLQQLIQRLLALQRPQLRRELLLHYYLDVHFYICRLNSW